MSYSNYQKDLRSFRLSLTWLKMRRTLKIIRVFAPYQLTITRTLKYSRKIFQRTFKENTNRLILVHCDFNAKLRKKSNKKIRDSKRKLWVQSEKWMGCYLNELFVKNCLYSINSFNSKITKLSTEKYIIKVNKK